jgi:predicted nucleic acid-binding protein
VILYLDTSALVKLYVEEPGTGAVVAGVERARAVVTVRVTYAEARAAFARHAREGGASPAQLRRVTKQLDVDWGSYGVIEVTEPLVHRAGMLAERHALRGYDAVQLAAALEVRRAGGEVEFACFDARLSLAARRERLSPARLPLT